MAKSPPLVKRGVTWTKAQRKRVYGSVEPLAVDPVPLTAAQAWKTLHEHYLPAKLFPLSESPPCDPDLAVLLEELRAELRSPSIPALRPDPLREFLRFQLVTYERVSNRTVNLVAELLALWTAQLGLSSAVEMLIAKVPVETSTISNCIEARVTARAAPEGGGTSLDAPGRELLLRRQVLAAPLPDYDAAWRRCRELRPPAQRMHLLNAFCRDPSEAHALVASTAPGTVNLACLLSGVFDPQLAMVLARGLPAYAAGIAAPHAFDLVDNLGSAAAPALLELLRQVASGDRQALADAAALADLELARAAVPGLSGPAKTALAKAVR